jgi:hypothetical protein
MSKNCKRRGRRQMAEDKGQKSEDRGQKLRNVKSPKSKELKKKNLNFNLPGKADDIHLLYSISKKEHGDSC